MVLPAAGGAAGGAATGAPAGPCPRVRLLVRLAELGGTYRDQVLGREVVAGVAAAFQGVAALMPPEQVGGRGRGVRAWWGAQGAGNARLKGGGGDTMYAQAGGGRAGLRWKSYGVWGLSAVRVRWGRARMSGKAGLGLSMPGAVERHAQRRQCQRSNGGWGGAAVAGTCAARERCLAVRFRRGAHTDGVKGAGRGGAPSTAPLLCAQLQAAGHRTAGVPL